MVYEWKQDRFDADPQLVGEELEAIEYKDAASVVNAARKTKCELHKCFEWDDSKAGEEYRKDQARLIMRMITTTIEHEEDGEEISIRIRAFESVKFADEDGKAEKNMTYIPIREALSDLALRKQVMDRLDSTIAEAERTATSYSYLVPEFKKTKGKLHEARETLKV